MSKRPTNATHAASVIFLSKKRKKRFRDQAKDLGGEQLVVEIIHV